MSTDGLVASSQVLMPSIPLLQANSATPDFLGLPQELKDMIYDDIASEYPRLYRLNNTLPATDKAFRERHTLLFVNRQISDEFRVFLHQKTPVLYIAVDKHEQPIISDTSHGVWNPRLEGYGRIQVHITTTGMHVCDILDILSCTGIFWGTSKWEMDCVNIICTDPTKSEVGIWYGEYTFETIGPKIFRTTFLKKTVDEEGIVEVTEGVVVVKDRWFMDIHLLKEEHDRTMKAAEGKGRWIEDGEWRDKDGPLSRPSRPSLMIES